MRIIDFFNNGVRSYRDNCAFKDDTGTLSYGEADAQVRKIGAAIKGHGYKKQTHIGILAPNSNVAFVALLGLFRAEAIWLPINPRNPVAINADLLDRFDCEVLLYHGDYAEESHQLKALLPSIKEFICLTNDDPAGISLASWSSSQPESSELGLEGPDDLFAIFPTGGTTGKSKGVMISHRNVECMFAHMWSHFTYREGSNHLVIAPMTHTAGLFGCLHFAKGGCNTILPGADIPRILSMIAQEKITHLFVPPTVMYMMQAHEDAAKNDYSSLQHFLVGAAPTSLDKLRAALKVFGPVMTEVYGQSEAPATITLKAPWDYRDASGVIDDRRLSSIGQAGMFNEVAILNSEGQELPRGNAGEICVRGPLVTPGYYKNEAATREVRTFGWHHTGDVGVMDADGFITIVDRMKDMIISGGFNVYPNEIEQVLNLHPTVYECAVIGVPDEKWGEAVNAFVVLKPGQKANELELIAFVKDQLGSVKAPKTVHLVNDLPRSPVGKILKTELRKKFWDGHSKAIA
ncbi:MAG: class I adenylate-forming enzyme family protein [Stenotrophobium sp.]